MARQFGQRHGLKQRSILRSTNKLATEDCPFARQLPRISLHWPNQMEIMDQMETHGVHSDANMHDDTGGCLRKCYHALSKELTTVEAAYRME